MFKRSFLFVLLVLMSGPWAWGTTYHVKPDGNDYGDGLSWEQAWRTLQRADGRVHHGDQIHVVLPGDTVLIRAVDEQGELQKYHETLNPFVNGSQQQWVTYRGEDDDLRPVLSAKVPLDSVKVPGSCWQRLDTLDIPDNPWTSEATWCIPLITGRFYNGDCVAEGDSVVVFHAVNCNRLLHGPSGGIGVDMCDPEVEIEDAPWDLLFPGTCVIPAFAPESLFVCLPPWMDPNDTTLASRWFVRYPYGISVLGTFEETRHAYLCFENLVTVEASLGGVEMDHVTHCVVRNCEAREGGKAGFNAAYGDHILLLNCESHNNLLSRGEASGIHIYKPVGQENYVVGCSSHDNFEYNAWCRYWGSEGICPGDGNGFEYDLEMCDEIPARCYFINNLAYNNSASGICIHGSDRAVVVGNTCFHNCLDSTRKSDEYTREQVFPMGEICIHTSIDWEEEERWVTSLQVRNNLLISDAHDFLSELTMENPILLTRNITSEVMEEHDMHWFWDYNLYYRLKTPDEDIIGRAGSVPLTLELVRESLGFDLHSQRDSVHFVSGDFMNFDYHLVGCCRNPAVDAGDPETEALLQDVYQDLAAWLPAGYSGYLGKDLDGEERLTGTAVDLGADELSRPCYNCLFPELRLPQDQPGTLILSWENVPGCAGYVIYYSESPYGDAGSVPVDTVAVPQWVGHYAPDCRKAFYRISVLGE